MLRLTLTLPSRSQNLYQYAAFKSSAPINSLRPPLDLDPSMQALLKGDISLKSAKVSPKALRELELLDNLSIEQPQLSLDDWKPMVFSDTEIADSEDSEAPGHRKSPATLFGSRRIGTVILPLELHTAIKQLIADGNKSQIQSDAKRLFQSDTDEPDEPEWDTRFEQNYVSRQQAFRHGLRDGSAFASVALPAHYSGIMSVLHQVKSRMIPGWEVKRIIDWGSGVGSGLWASIHSFQNAPTDEEHDSTAINSTITSYLGVDKREGLISIGKKLVTNTPIGDLSVRWQKYFKKDDVIHREDGRDTIALSAFFLTSLSDHVQRKELVKEMWKSGAHTVILIDHNSKDGFEAIAHARQYMLDMGKAELEDPDINWSIRGSHVLAPCPHDQICPLLNKKRAPLICGFSQRMQRPPFVRLHQKKSFRLGYEDMQFSYVVIQRGARPERVDTNVGRIGEVGKRAIKFSKTPIKELEVHVEGVESALPSPTEIPDVADPDHGLSSSEAHVEGVESPLPSPTEIPDVADPDHGLSSSEAHVEGVESPLPSPTEIPDVADPDHGLSSSEIEAQLRIEAYQWPRLVFPPMKRGGHVILDACTVDGKIMRLTIAKSQGKQAYYDARKSKWGDIFPHPPKNRALVRFVPDNPRAPSSGEDIGKRGDSFKVRERLSYEAIVEAIQASRKKSKREYARTRGSKVWEDVDDDTK